MSGTLPTDPEMRALLTNVAVRVPGAGLDLLASQVLSAMREFCENTGAWSADATITTDIGVTDYDLAALPGALPAGARIVWLAGVWNSTTPLSLRTLPYTAPAPLLLVGAGGSPRSAEQVAPGVLRITPKPDAKYVLFVSMILSPTGLDDALPPGWVARNEGVLSDGAWHRLFATPAMPFTSEKLATFHGRRFRSGMAVTRATRIMGDMQGLQPARLYPLPAAHGAFQR